MEHRLMNILGERLINELLKEPKKFYEEGKAYELLQEYFNGFSLTTLSPLLTNDDRIIQRVAIWIVSELGKEGCSLIHDVIPLIHDNDRYIQYHALEIVMVCSFANNTKEFVHVVNLLQSDDEIIRILVMRLISNANASQLKMGIRLFESNDFPDSLHKQGLSNLLRCDQLKPEQVTKMINDKESLVRKYGIMIAKRIFHKFPNLIQQATMSIDPDIRKFSFEVIEMNKVVL